MNSVHSETRFVFVTGGVLSGIGKGVTTASIAKLLQFRSYNVSIIKIDPYLNIDPGTLNPIEHGEVFVTDQTWVFKPAEGFEFKISEIDLDFGTYERFTGMEVHPSQNITSGQIYTSVILGERKGSFLGRTVQIIPHITDRIKKRIWDVVEEQQPDVLLIEIGGTVGDIEAMPFLEDDQFQGRLLCADDELHRTRLHNVDVAGLRAFFEDLFACLVGAFLEKTKERV